ncbi:hypothetical protein F66182_4482 [Fusarium sp. NRRL 66182]|nr:hypothetical protein F66182_4482 [Fusarium sp. NRRL 66182]
MLTRLPRLTLAHLTRLRTTPHPRLSSTMSSGDQQQQGSGAAAREGKNPLPLPAPEQDTTAGRGHDVTELRVGESVRLDAMGPLVVNTDGTMGRIGNWAGMTEGEREQTLKLLGTRNKQRLDALKAKRAAGEDKE